MRLFYLFFMKKSQNTVLLNQLLVRLYAKSDVYSMQNDLLEDTILSFGN